MKRITKILKTFLIAAVVAVSVGMITQNMVPEKVNAAGTEAILSKDFTGIDAFYHFAVSFQKGTKDAYEANQASAKEIQDSLSPEKIYMWHNSSYNFYWYSPADTVCLPVDSSNLFYYCNQLATIDLEGFDASKVTNMNSMFGNCSKLTSIDMGNWDMSKVTTATDAFNGLSNLTEITFPATYSSNPQSNGSLSGFYKVNDDGSTTDTAYDLTKLNQTTTPTLAGRWTKNPKKPWTVISSNFKSLVFYNWPSASYAASANSFQQGTKADYEANKNYAREVQDSFSPEKIYMWHDTSNNYYWYSPANKVYLPADCSNLFKYDSNASSGGKWTSYRGVTKIDLTGLSWDLVTNTNSMFASNGNLSSINLGNINTSNVTDMADMFDYCPKLTTLDVSNFDTSKVINMNSMFYYCSSLTSLDVSKWNTSKVTNMNSMFYDCSSLTSLDVSNFDTSNVSNMGNMFNDCSSLTNLDVSKWNTSNVTSMYGMFQRCSKLTDLDVSHFDTSNVTSTASMFSVCSSVTSLDIGKWNTSNVTYMAGMFSGCSKLTTLDVSNWDTSKVTGMSSMFSGCSNLTSLDVSKFNTSKVTGMSSMFSGCSSLTSLDLSNFDTSTVTSKASEGFMTDEKDMFKGMTSLQKITFGNGFKVVPPTTDRWGRTYGGIGSQPIMQDWHKTADADGNSVSGAPIVNLGTLIDSNDASVPGTWTKVKPFSYWLSVKDSDGKPIKNYALTEKDIFVYGESADKTGYITKTDSSSAIVDNDMMVHLKYPESNADLVHKEGDEGVSIDTSIKDSRSVYTLNIVPAIGSGYQAKTVTIRANLVDGISSDTTKCEINGAAFNPDKGILTVTLDKQSESSDTPSDNAAAQYFAKEKEVEINDNADFVLKLSTPSTTGQTYSADNTANDMSYGILLDTIPGIDTISETSSESETDKTTVSNWVKTWSVKIGDTVLSDDQKAAAFQNYVPVFKQAKTYEGDLVNVAGVKMDLTYLESIGLAGQPVEITMSHKVVSEKLKDGKYTTKAFVYSDSSYDALFSAVTSVNSDKDPFADYGSVTDSDGIGRIHIYNAASGNNAPNKDFAFKIVPDDDAFPLPEGAKVLTDDNGKKYATVTIKGNGMYTGTLVFPKSGTKTYGYTISTVSDGTDGWTFDNTTYHTVFSDDNGSIGAWTGDISINGTLLCVHNESAVYPQPEWTWNKDLEKSYYDKISDVKQKVLNTISIVDTALLPNNLGFAFEQTYKSESVPATPKLTSSRFAKMAFVSTPNVDYDMTVFKDVTGDSVPDKYSFSAVIAPDDEDCPMPSNADSWYDTAKHTVTLDSSDGGRARTLNFTATAPGTYGYTVTEVKDGRYGWDYDTHTYHVTYTVADGAVSSIVQTVDGTAITDAQKDANATAYKAYVGSDPTSKDALVTITNNHFTMTTPTGVYGSGVKPLIVACVVIGAAVISFVLIRNKKR